MRSMDENTARRPRESDHVVVLNGPLENAARPVGRRAQTRQGSRARTLRTNPSLRHCRTTVVLFCNWVTARARSGGRRRTNPSSFVLPNDNNDVKATVRSAWSQRFVPGRAHRRHHAGHIERVSLDADRLCAVCAVCTLWNGERKRSPGRAQCTLGSTPRPIRKWHKKLTKKCQKVPLLGYQRYCFKRRKYLANKGLWPTHEISPLHGTTSSRSAIWSAIENHAIVHLAERQIAAGLERLTGGWTGENGPGDGILLQ
jgi:hypothetical protein